MNKRTFIRNIAAFTALSPFISFDLSAKEAVTDPYPDEDEAFWERIRRDYSLKPDYINLENGYYNIAPIPTLKKFISHVEKVNYEGSYYMRTVQWENKKRIASRLADWLGCQPGELIITRNTTESMDMIISGFPWQSGDEAIFAQQDYGSMIDQFGMVSRRHGVVNRIISVPNNPASDEQIVALYEEQINSRTKLIMVCHMINITGQILPIRKICDMAHSYGVEVLVDGAHCVGHINVNIQDLHCDYYASSLHKWLSTPLGAGILYVSQPKIKKIWPLLAEHAREDTDISRLNHTGTHPVHTDLSIEDAMDYIEMIGLERKEKRLRFLQRYWSEQLRNTENVVINTPADPVRSCGIGNIGVSHIKPTQLAETLLKDFGIFTVAIDGAGVHGCRVTPNVYTTTEELDRFITAIQTLASSK